MSGESWKETVKLIDELLEETSKKIQEMREDENISSEKSEIKKEPNPFQSDIFYKKYLDNLEYKHRKYKSNNQDSKTQQTTVHQDEFSDDLESYKEDVQRFIDYVKFCTFLEDFTYIFLERRESKIIYGKMQKGIKTDKCIINMVSAADLQEIYHLLKIEFASDFHKGSKHTFGMGWTLLPTIGENVIIDIDSDNHEDRNWFYEEKDSREIIDMPISESESKINIKK